MWLKRLLYGEKRMWWKLYFDYTFKTVGGRFIFLCNYDTILLKLKTPLFYLEILRAWQDMENNRNFNEGKINSIFFNNKDYLCKGGKHSWRIVCEKYLFSGANSWKRSL